MRNKSYIQTNFESCLPICLLLLANKNFTKKEEFNLTVAGIKASRKSYAIGMLDAFTKKYRFSVDVYVDNKYFLNILKKELLKLKNRYVNLVYKPINEKILKNENTPYILYVDHHDLGVYSHVPHFITVEKKYDNYFIIFDPWAGKKEKISEKILNKAVINLRSYIKYCPLLIKGSKNGRFNSVP